ncbi:hypothetical protein A2886_01630 [candidate division WWE3 bacterium RIFCSPHIGHO2_01_FULL_42_13]|uniref:Uncharacterized protein n=1 Tax=candidate division WWE3 bacterium RIFCSPHIGHO2_01_FULL_42_13 TaxID=1802617 RepID=A0A1F4USM2_UNCKA|nr:MAG: hypothetical protein A2886_01630 [candidate division WWE3 bacterium RIFCSPHIGHO2_01_FULL_42_13]
MVTIVNPSPSNDSSNGGGMGFLVGAILIIFFGFLFFVYGLPMIRDVMNDGVEVNVRTPDDVKLNVEEPAESTQ